MKLLSPVLIVIMLIIAGLTACKKNPPAEPKNSDPNPITQTGNTTTYLKTGYVVKTIGISRINVTLDDNNQFIEAKLFGGGNSLTLKPGTSIQQQWVGLSFENGGSGFGGTTAYQTGTIDNGSMSDTSGIILSVYKLKGFDKSKVGYNQLNIVFYDYERPSYIFTYVSTLFYLNLNTLIESDPVKYSTTIFQKIVNGNIDVSDITIAPPQSQKPNITQDETFENASVDESAGSIGLTGQNYQVNFNVRRTFPYYQLIQPENVKTEWVNASNGTVTKISDLVYKFTLTNIKQGKLNQIVEPADTSTYAFLRISGLDQSIFGINQLRFFPLNEYDHINGNVGYDGSFQVKYTTKPTATPTLLDLEKTFLGTGQYLTYLGPISD